jgi:hypothetical protein
VRRAKMGAAKAAEPALALIGQLVEFSAKFPGTVVREYA